MLPGWGSWYTLTNWLVRGLVHILGYPMGRLRMKRNSLGAAEEGTALNSDENRNPLPDISLAKKTRKRKSGRIELRRKFSLDSIQCMNDGTMTFVSEETRSVRPPRSMRCNGVGPGSVHIRRACGGCGVHGCSKCYSSTKTQLDGDVLHMQWPQTPFERLSSSDGALELKPLSAIHSGWRVQAVHLARKLSQTGWVQGLLAGEVYRYYPDSKVHGANMGPIWGRQDPGGTHFGPMNLVIWVRLKCDKINEILLAILNDTILFAVVITIH